jgi:hypothetical protein
MGFEYRLLTKPTIENLVAACDDFLSGSDYRRIDSGLHEASEAIGIGLAPSHADAARIPADWPQIVDLCRERDGRIYLLCHSQAGVLFMNAWLAHLREHGYAVDIDDDV